MYYLPNISFKAIAKPPLPLKWVGSISLANKNEVGSVQPKPTPYINLIIEINIILLGVIVNKKLFKISKYEPYSSIFFLPNSLAFFPDIILPPNIPIQNKEVNICKTIGLRFISFF